MTILTYTVFLGQGGVVVSSLLNQTNTQNETQDLLLWNTSRGVLFN
jgi:hypothetical protein